ncbi:MAG: transcriptional regulator [Candidatus Cloacimonadota bacterium]|nr:MAG: transcriptional regulator [Candidatus Cloacimonadota bacterium]
MNDKVFKALADKNRRKILQLLKENDMTAGKIAEHFSISKPSISEHLKILKNADLIGSEKKGQYVNYFLNTSVIEGFISSVWELFGDNKEGKNEK